jgi:hypothetical protein
MDAGEIWGPFNKALYDDLKKEDLFPYARPLLAHYTSLSSLESILKTDEIWFSNPLFMNDVEEIIFGIVHGITKIRDNSEIKKSLVTSNRYDMFGQILDHYIQDFEERYLIDTYVFCLSEHNPENLDGMLSMWRGYGGNGKGAALVLDTSKIGVVDDSPIWILRVSYGSQDRRFEWLDQIASKFARTVAENDIPDEQIYLATHALFDRIKLFPLSTKHDGFKEEREWRAVYLSDRDDSGRLKHMQHYLNGPRGVEPKLKLKLEPMEGVTALDFLPKNILANILLGPSTSSALAVRSVERMLDLIQKPELKDRLVASTIPLRAT